MRVMMEAQMWAERDVPVRVEGSLVESLGRMWGFRIRWA